ncbi:MAG: hypothetical protein IMX04_08155 [Candidatus Carbobacillus altaicus]|nr:hypothetical protein [Candidatus Carbobacillus altaicus]
MIPPRSVTPLSPRPLARYVHIWFLFVWLFAAFFIWNDAMLRTQHVVQLEEKKEALVREQEQLERRIQELQTGSSLFQAEALAYDRLSSHTQKFILIYDELEHLRLPETQLSDIDYSLTGGLRVRLRVPTLQDAARQMESYSKLNPYRTFPTTEEIRAEQDGLYTFDLLFNTSQDVNASSEQKNDDEVPGKGGS